MKTKISENSRVKETQSKKIKGVIEIIELTVLLAIGITMLTFLLSSIPACANKFNLLTIEFSSGESDKCQASLW